MYMAQKNNPTNGDFVQLIQEKLAIIEETYDERAFKALDKFELNNPATLRCTGPQ